MVEAGFVIAAYLLGSISFGILMSKVFGLPDPRTVGSGNPGATNVLRSGKKLAAFLTLFGDAFKGYLAVWAAARYGLSDMGICLVGLSVFIGHLYPVYYAFKGGKGVATFFGLLLAAAWPLGLLAGATWLIAAALFRMSSLAALIASAAAPVYAILPLEALGLPTSGPVLVLALVTAALIWVRHLGNIGRILKGAEPRIGAKQA